MTREEFKPDWEVEPVPCTEPRCTPAAPFCDNCLAGKAAFEAEGLNAMRWRDLEEWMREAWRQEAADV
jgi:hypothetical protein